MHLDRKRTTDVSCIYTSHLTVSANLVPWDSSSYPTQRTSETLIQSIFPQSSAASSSPLSQHRAVIPGLDVFTANNHLDSTRTNDMTQCWPISITQWRLLILRALLDGNLITSTSLRRGGLGFPFRWCRRYHSDAKITYIWPKHTTHFGLDGL